MRDITSYIDVAQITLYVFWAFFFALIFWLRKEDRREGYPLESDLGGVKDRGVGLLFARPKTFLTRDGHTFTAPNFRRDERPVAARRAGNFPGAPLIPTGNPLVDGVGPAAWAERADRPDTTWDGKPKIVPARVDGHHTVASGDPDPRGMTVYGADRKPAGTVADIWIDRSEQVIRYLEVNAGGGSVLVPMNLAKIVGNSTSGRSVKVKSITSAQFAQAPRTKAPDTLTFLEEDRIMAYFAGGNLYATAKRGEPLL